MIRNTLIVGVVVLLAIAAAVDAFRGGGPPKAAATTEAVRTEAVATDRLEGPDLPPPEALPGRIYFTTIPDCRLRTIDLASLKLGEPGPMTSCDFWVSPDGREAAATVGRVGPPRGDLRELWLVRLGDPPELVRKLGIAHGEAAWSPDGARLAWCAPDGGTVVLALASGRTSRIVGCRPRFAPDGSLLSRANWWFAGRLLRNGDSLLDTRDLAAGLRGTSRRQLESLVPGALSVLGYDENADDLVAVAVLRMTHRGPKVVLEVWRNGLRKQDVYLGAGGFPFQQYRFGDRVEFSPRGDELAVSFPGDDVELTLVDPRSGRKILPALLSAASAWSPDGSWFATSTGEEIRIYGPGRTDPAYIVPAPAVRLAWR